MFPRGSLFFHWKNPSRLRRGSGGGGLFLRIILIMVGGGGWKLIIMAGGVPPHDVRGSHDAATGCLTFCKHSKNQRGVGGAAPPSMMFEALMIQQRGALISAHILRSSFQPCPPPHTAKQTNWPAPCLQGLFPAWKLTFSVKVCFLGSKLLADPFQRLVSPGETKVFGGRGKVCFSIGN